MRSTSRSATWTTTVSELSVEMRLQNIISAHRQDVDLHGGTSGYCIECQWAWPCLTYRNATQPEVTGGCAWDLDDCECDNDHRVPL